MEKSPKYSFLCNIPSAILWEILFRLPVKTCLNCKLVCKNWYNIITSPEFSSFRYSNGTHHTLISDKGLIMIKDRTFQLLDIDKASCVDKMGNFCVGVDATIKFRPKFKDYSDRVVLSGICNGVVCLKSYDVEDYHVLNLLTGQMVTVGQYQGYVSECDHDAFGYCLATNKYKILVSTPFGLKNKAMVINVGDKDWRCVGEAPMRSWKEKWCFLNGSSHQRARWYIWALHWGNEKFSRIPLSKQMKGFEGAELITFNSCLSFCCRLRGDSRTHIWVMKEYGVQDSWVKLYVIDKRKFSIRQPILRLNSGRFLLNFNWEVVVYDPEKSGQEKVVKVNHPSSCELLLKDFMEYNANFSKF